MQTASFLGKRTNQNRIHANIDRTFTGNKAPYNQLNNKYNSQDELDYEDEIGDVNNIDGLNIQINSGLNNDQVIQEPMSQNH